MVINYLYIDDEKSSSLESLANSVSFKTDNNELNIDYRNPSDFKFDVENLVTGVNHYKGLILDWRLDKIPDNGEYFRFRAGSIAQEIRIRQAEGSIVPIPIVLWSTNENLKDSYTSDSASHDLFDLQHDKTNIPEHNEEVSNQLMSLAVGYPDIGRYLNGEGKIDLNVLRVEEDDFQFLPPSFTEFLKQLYDLSVHEYARIFLKEIIQKPGVLVSENLLAAKFGIDREQSKDWNSLIDHLEPFKYRGPFHELWDRWWWHLISKKWWKDVAPAISSLQSFEADERVKAIISVFGFENLKTAQGIQPNYQTNFQTICEYFQKPLDTYDGVTIKEKEPYMWQEKRYLSLLAALKRFGADKGLRPHPVEIDRLNLLKEN